MRRLFSVFFSYSVREAENMACKLVEEELVEVVVVLDMVTAARRELSERSVSLADEHGSARALLKWLSI